MKPTLRRLRVVSMDGSTIASPLIQAAPHFIFTQPKSKRRATHSNIARSISVHQQVVKMDPFWPAAPARTAPLLGAAKPYNLNMVPPPDLHAAGEEPPKTKSSALFPAQPASKDKSPLPYDTTTSDANNARPQEAAVAATVLAPPELTSWCPA